MSLSARLAAHVASAEFAALPVEAVEAAKRSLLDALGVTLGASGLEPACGPFVDLATTAGGVQESTILSGGRKAPAHLAAFANGAMAHALDFEDTFDEAPLHPNAAIVPAALALAEARGDVSGREFLAALAVGCDLTCRLALATRSASDQGWYMPPVFGMYGAVAAACRILRLSADQTLDAFSLALHQSAISGEIKYNPQSTHRAIRDAFPAQSAVLCAALAARGVRGFALPFEGKSGFFRLFAGGVFDEAPLVTDLGAQFLGARVSFKPWPSCRGTHAYVEIALDLRERHRFAPGDIAAIRGRGGALELMLMAPFDAKAAPTTSIDAKFSLPFVVATALLRGDVRLADFLASALAAEDVRVLARRFEYAVDEGLPRKSAAAGALAVHLADGRVLEGAVEDTRGSCGKPLSNEALVSKAIQCAAHAARPVSEGRVRRLADVIWSLERAPDSASLLMGAVFQGDA